MKTLVFAISALLAGMFSVNIASAAVVFNSLNVAAGSFNAGSDGFTEQPLAASFFASGSPTFSSITLELAATAPADNGSIGVYIVPDDGTGGGLGKGGSPTYTPGGAAFSAFTGAQRVGTILDSSLSTSPSAVTVKVAPNTPTVTTSDGEYWVGLVYSGSSSAQWYFNSDGSGVGTANQADFNSNGGLGPFPVSEGVPTRWSSKLQSLPALPPSVQVWQGSASSAVDAKVRIKYHPTPATSQEGELGENRPENNGRISDGSNHA